MRHLRLVPAAFLLALACGLWARAQTPGQPAAGPVDLRFRLYDGAKFGGQVGTELDRPGVTLLQGRFTLDLDFGPSAFGPDARWLSTAGSRARPSA
jgi:hypothetical protein